MNDWNTLISSSTLEYIDQNDTLLNIYQIFSDLYTPFKFGNYIAANYFEGKNKYFVIQNEVNYEVLTDEVYKNLVFNSSEGYPNDTAYEFYKTKKKLCHFRPKIASDNIGYLYLTNEYKNAFLRSVLRDLGCSSNKTLISS